VDTVQLCGELAAGAIGVSMLFLREHSREFLLILPWMLLEVRAADCRDVRLFHDFTS